jgi:predicted nucleic acid-binding protein
VAVAYVDANVFIYATAGDSAAVPNCGSILRFARAHRGTCATSAETLQEILHVLGRQNAMDRVLDALRLAVATTEVLTLHAEDVLLAASFDLPGRFSARDRLHRAVMQRHQIAMLITADRDFDDAHGVARLDPAEFESWKDSVFRG